MSVSISDGAPSGVTNPMRNKPCPKRLRLIFPFILFLNEILEVQELLNSLSNVSSGMFTIVASMVESDGAISFMPVIVKA